MSVMQRMIDSCKKTTSVKGVQSCSCGITVTDAEWTAAGGNDTERERNLIEDGRSACAAACGIFGCDARIVENDGTRRLVGGCHRRGATAAP
jgi:hypothetical protein